jgi:hypothetical protein
MALPRGIFTLNSRSRRENDVEEVDRLGVEVVDEGGVGLYVLFVAAEGRPR